MASCSVMYPAPTYPPAAYAVAARIGCQFDWIELSTISMFWIAHSRCRPVPVGLGSIAESGFGGSGSTYVSVMVVGSSRYYIFESYEKKRGNMAFFGAGSNP